jgi:hypothetical protein
MGKGFCIECGQSGVEVRPVHTGSFVCLKCLSTYSKKWIDKQFPGTPDNPEGDAVVDLAVSKMGMSHDDMPCSTLICQSFPDKDLPEGTDNQYHSKIFKPVDRRDIRKGDVVFFESDDGQGRINHVGIVLGTKPDGSFTFIHSSLSRGVSTAKSTQIGGYGKSTWDKLVTGFKRVK